MQFSKKYWLDFTFTMTLKEIKARYKRVLFGFIWIFLNPLLQMLVIGFIFQYFVPMRTDNYFSFLFAGLLPWNFISYTVNKCTPLFMNERSLIQKANFPRESLVFSIVFSNLFHFFCSLLLLIVYTLIFSFLTLSKFFILIFAIMILIIFVSGLSLLLSTLFVKFRDIKFIVSALMPIWFYATPIIYQRSFLPLWLDTLIQFNPATGILELFQYVFVDTFSIDYKVVLLSVFISICFFILGTYIFNKNCAYFDDWL